MRKKISLLLSIILSISTISFCAGNIYSVKAEEISINSFIEDGVKLIRENDGGKEFVPEEIKKDIEIENDYDESVQIRSFAKNQDNEAEYSEKEEFSDTAFQTCRLIVKASETPDKLNSIGMASGFRDWYIIQFETEEDTRSAYDYYLEKDEIVKVTPDAVHQRKYYIEPDEPNDEKNDPSDLNGSIGRLNSWGSICTGLYDVKDYIETNAFNTQEIVVGLIDSGINYNLEYFEGRIIRTYANYSGTGDENDEMDQTGHGTMVASIIIDNAPQNVRIATYCNGEYIGMESESAIAIISAVNDQVDILNCSFGNTNETGLLGDALDYAHEKDIPVVAAGGNFSENIHFNNSCWPAYDEKTISVGGFSNNGLPTIWTAFGKELDLLAPCENLPCVSTQGKTKTMSGTSFSAPMAVSLFTQMMTLYPELSNEEIEHKIKASADATDMFYECGLFGYGVIDAIGSAAFDRNESPDFSLPEGKYIDEIAVEISAEPGCEIYYTLDSSYPSKENGILYTEPVRISDDCPYLKAVAYKEGAMRSEMAKSLYRLQRMGTDDMFTISGDGQIISYTGEVFDLIIPEKINGITVTGIASNTFSESNLSGVSFPDTLSEISEYAFENSDNLLLADGKNIKTIGHNAFESCTSLTLVDFPAVEIIGNHAFVYCDSLSGISLPNCREIDAGGFQYCSSMRCAHLPKVTTLNGNVFQQDAMLTDVYLPSLKEFTNTALISGDFRECGFPEPLDLPKIEFTQKGTFTTLYLKRLEFSQVQVIRRLNLKSLDVTNYCDKSICVVLPSTLREIQGYSEGSNYRVYGTKGTYAEQWANENEFEFVEITPETAVITDLPESFYDYMRYLEVDVIGFNRTYQWYGSYADQNTGGVPIVGATERRFVPKENEQYPYYYCVVTSTDVGYDPIEIRTGASKYMEFSSETPGADYSVGDIIEYGLYPQSEVKDQETINKLISAADPDIISYGYFSGTGSWDDGEMALSDFMSYKDVAYKGNIYRIVGVDDYRPYYTGGTSSSNYQQQNGYCAPGLYCFKFEPIKWRVLDSESGLVICDSAIDSQPFNNFVLKSGTDSKGNDAYWGDTDQTYYANNYAKSSIREWLNNDFYNTAFSDSQKENIKTTTITNTGYFTLNGQSGYEEYDSGETNDKIFLLSYEDVNNESYWSNSPKPISKSASATEYAACQGLLSTSDNDCSWWLRTSNNSDTSSIINCGSVGFETVGKTSIGVVPAMKLNTLINEPITYTATFVADGNVVDIVEYYSGTGEVIEPVPPAKEGYWWHWDNYELTGNITINAIYETIGYIACFVNGNNIIAQIPYTIETENITPPPVPEKAGYTSEWEDYSLEVGGITVQVLFTPNIYEVDLVVDGEVIGTIDYTYDDENPDLPTVPEKKGYTGEWVINQDDGNVVIHAEYTPINYYATFMADGNQVGDKVPFTVESISIIEPAVPEKEGYENGRWEDYTLGATDITINAVYDKIEGTCSHVDSNDDGKCDKCCEPMTYTKDIIVDGVKIGEVTFTYGDSIIDNLPDVPAKTGYTGEWEYTLNGSNLDIHPQYTPITYYATFKADGNQVSEKVPFTVESESISEPKIPDKEGYTGKWTEYIIAASDITINAEYSINDYTVSFIADDKIIKSEIVEFGSKIKIPEKPQKAGYIFKEWLPKVPETMPAKDMTFYAVFEEEKQPELKPDISIRNFVNSRTVDYRTTITFTAAVNNMPEGATIIWYKDDQRAGTGEKFTVKEAKEAFTVQAKIVDKSGNTLDSTETELVIVKADFFSRIIAFFRMLFGKLPIIEQ